MATNKRKEAAALFELIDKSTLKVPKNAGALKIPSWWSSKTNPETAAPAGASVPPPTPVTNGRSTPASSQGASGPIARKPITTPQAKPETTPLADVPASPTPAPSAPTPPSVIQHRLFEPPPASSAAQAPSPSIRPPVIPAPVSPAIKTPLAPPIPPPLTPPAGPAPVQSAVSMTPPAEDVAEPAETAPLPEETSVPEASHSELPPPAGRTGAAKIFAPATYSQSARKPWSPPRAGSFARLPHWVLLAGVVGVVVVICCVVLLLKGRSKQAAPVNPPPRMASPGPVEGPSLSRDTRSLLPPAPAPQPVPTVDNQGPAPSASGDGRVFPPGAVTHSPDLLYIVICTTPSQDIAQRNADFIAKNGVDVSVETHYSNNRLLYSVVSVQGFPTNSAAEPTRARIVQIGHTLPEYRRTRKAWDDAMIRKVGGKSASN